MEESRPSPSVPASTGLTWYFRLLGLILLAAPLGALIDPRMGNIRNFHILLTAITLVFILRRPAVRLRLPGRPGPLLLWLGFTSLIACIACVLTHYLGLRLNGEDFSIFDWMLYNTNHREFMTTPICNMTRPPDVCHHFGVHPSWIMIPLAPLHRLLESPLFLQMIHALAVWSALVPGWLLARRYLEDPLLCLLATAALLLNSFTGSLLNHGFHTEVFYLPLGLWFVHGWLSARPVQWLTAFVLFLLVKEDAAFYTLSFAGGVLLFARERWRSATLILSLSALILWFNLQVAQPWFLSQFEAVRPKYMRFWGHLGESPSAILLTLLHHPLDAAGQILSSGWSWFFGLALFLPLCSRIPLLAMLPTIALFGLSNNPHMRGYATYYPAALLPFFFWGWLEAWRNLQRIPLTARRLLFAASFLCFSLAGGGYQKFPLPRPGTLTDLQQIRQDLAGHNGPLCVQTIFFPHLPYEWQLWPLQPGCMQQEGALGIATGDPTYDPYPWQHTSLQALLATHDVRKVYPSGLTVFSRRDSGDQ